MGLPRTRNPPPVKLRLKSGGVDVPHGKADASLTIDLQNLHADDISLLELVADTLDALVGDLRDVHQAVAARQDGHERAEVHQPCDLPLVDAPDLHVRGNELDAPLRLAPGGTADGCDLDRAVALDVDRGAGLLRDLPDHRAAFADDVPDLLRIDLERDDRRRPLRHLRARLADDLGHFPEDVQPAVARLIESDAHDLGGDTFDLDVHLQRRDAVARARHLEVHVAEMVFVAEDVGEHLVAAALEHPSHRHTGHGRLDRHTGIHQC